MKTYKSNKTRIDHLVKEILFKSTDFYNGIRPLKEVKEEVRRFVEHYTK